MKIIKIFLLLMAFINISYAQESTLSDEDKLLIAGLKEKDAFKVRQALVFGANPNKKVNGVPLLKDALDTQKENIISYFFEFGVDPNKALINNEYPLYYAMDILEEPTIQEKSKKNSKPVRIDTNNLIKQKFIVNLFAKQSKIFTIMSESKGSLLMYALTTNKLGFIIALYGQNFDLDEVNKKTNKTLLQTINSFAESNAYFNNYKNNIVFVKPLITNSKYDLDKDFKANWFAENLDQLMYDEKTSLFNYISNKGGKIELSKNKCSNFKITTSLNSKEDTIKLIEGSLGKIPNNIKIDDDVYPTMRTVCNDFDINFIMVYPNVLLSINKNQFNILMK